MMTCSDSITNDGRQAVPKTDDGRQAVQISDGRQAVQAHSGRQAVPQVHDSRPAMLQICDGRSAVPQLFRVWIAEFDQWQPAAWHDVPPAATALEPACGECLTAEQAALFLQGFNEAMLADLRQLWAVAVPVEIRLAGDLESGEPVHDVQRLAAAQVEAITE